ncbi:MAG: 4-hydroxy-tetrahydrodipicolinate reductase [Oscillospiraceae bacterium]|nr:4-hydroxy-tetrahydrodipicolinate reductase [Oscillospiraceae bacterium]
MYRIILSGCFGRMGREIASLARERGDCAVAAGIDRASGQAGYPVFARPEDCDVPADCIVDFSHPSLLEGVLSLAEKRRIPAVLCTTGCSEEQIARIRRASEVIPVFFSANMSLGVNLLAALAQKAAAVLGQGFDVEIVEKHHNQKLDAPSGTALLLAGAVSSALPEEVRYVYDRHSVREKRSKAEIGIHSVRGGTIVGDHDVIFAGPDEVITLSHHAASRQVFAAGALRAALFLQGAEPGLYDMGRLIESGGAQ